jgi:hypothetical protein
MSITLKSKLDGSGAVIEVNEVDELELTPEKLSIEGMFFENGKTITGNVTVGSSKNVMSAGPITIADGVVVTVASGGDWSIV